MSTAAASVVENPPKAGESAVEKPHGEVKSKIESGDVSGVYRIAQSEVDEELARGLGLSKIDDANTATIAGPEIVALKQADAEFENKAKTALGGLKTSMDSVGKPTETEAEKDARLNAVAEKAMAEGPMTVKEMAKDLEKHVTPEEAATAIPLTEVKKTVENPAEAVLDADIKRGVDEFEQGLQKIDADLLAEKKALEDFNSTHGKAHTPLEQAYLDALNGRVTALEFEKSVHEKSDTSFEAKAKQAELKQKADKAEAAYQGMYDGFMKQPVKEAAVTAPGVGEGLHLDEEDMNDQYEARQYQQFHGGSASPTGGMSRSNPMFEAGSMSAPQQKPKGRMGKFIDSLKFWKYMTGEQK